MYSEILTYYQCQGLMATAKHKHKGKPLMNNTRLYDCDGYYAIRLHNNTIMQIYPEGWQLFDGGWRTHTTKNRLNKYTPVSIYQRNWDWIINNGVDEFPFWNGVFIDNEKHGMYMTFQDYLKKRGEE